jgi:hypothetical protein
MKKQFSFLILLTLCIGMISSCKKDEDESLFVSNGSVNGTINGIAKDNTVLDESFSFNTYLDYMDKQYYQVTTSGEYEFEINYSREDGSSFDIEFTLSSATDVTPDDVYIRITNFTRKNNTLIYFFMPSTNNICSLSDFSFDANSGRAKGKIIVTGSNNSTDNSATVVANFDVNVVKRIE